MAKLDEKKKDIEKLVEALEAMPYKKLVSCEYNGRPISSSYYTCGDSIYHWGGPYCALGCLAEYIRPMGYFMDSHQGAEFVLKNAGIDSEVIKEIYHASEVNFKNSFCGARSFLGLDSEISFPEGVPSNIRWRYMREWASIRIKELSEKIRRCV